jgi:uncharacterized 2Fe-2S/4Fe-4S cluster protein (DUF4445 family)
VRRDEAGQALCETLGGGPARGYCGSGLVDAVALLLARGTLKASGRFALSPGEAGYALDTANARTALFGSDVDAFQRAKAATAAAMEQLLQGAGMDWSDISRLCVCGAFGQTLDVAHAQAVGLLPPVAPERVELWSDATLAGCERALLTDSGLALFSRLTEQVNALNLAFAAGYEDRYIRHLRLLSIPSIPSISCSSHTR